MSSKITIFCIAVAASFCMLATSNAQSGSRSVAPVISQGSASRVISAPTISSPSPVTTQGSGSRVLSSPTTSSAPAGSASRNEVPFSSAPVQGSVITSGPVQGSVISSAPIQGSVISGGSSCCGGGGVVSSAPVFSSAPVYSAPVQSFSTGGGRCGRQPFRRVFRAPSRSCGCGF